MNQENKNCTNCKKDFIITNDDFDFYAKIKVPVPTLCSLCRCKRRLMFRNFRTLYKRESSKSGEVIISMYHEDQPFPVWSTEEWYKDDWDGTDFGIDFDFNKTFFEKYKELNDKVPRFSLMVNNSKDCGYCNLCNRSSNCYFTFGCVDNEYCDYGHSIWNCRESLDCLYLFKSEFCYECIDVLDSNRMLYSQECESCADSIGLYDCRGCVDCIGCVGLRNKSYHIFNKQVSKEVYKEFLAKYPISNSESIKFILENRDKLKKERPMPYMFGSHNTDVTGNHVYHAKNVKDSFDVKSGEDSRFGYTIRNMVQSYDCNFSMDIENCYESLFSHPYGLKFCHLAIDCTDTSYSQFCFNSNNLFGCAGLRKKEYCILNKQYSKKEYEDLLPKIIEHMKNTGEYGEFFPVSLSPFTYNESTLGEYYPLPKQQAIGNGYNWRDDIPFTSGQENFNLGGISEKDIYNFDFMKDKIFSCQKCTRNYRFTDHELSFYERFKLSLPLECFFCRHDARMLQRDERVLYKGKCMCSLKNHNHGNESCNVEFKTTFNPDNKQRIVYCEKCYQQEVV